MNSVSSTISLRQTRTSNNSPTSPNVHERGDKVVINGAKESLKSILRRYTCKCGKHTGERMAQKFLAENRLTASYDVMVWMLIFLRVNCEMDLYMLILEEYLAKMEKKNKEDQNHQSEKYKSSKKKTLQKFIESAKFLKTDEINQDVIEKSVGALYMKGKSRENALTKIRAYLNKLNFTQCLNFVDSNCSLKLQHSLSIKSVNLENKQPPTNSLASDNSEGKIYDCDPHEITFEEIQMLNEDESWSQMFSSSKETHDLFQQLIQSNETDNSLRGSY